MKQIKENFAQMILGWITFRIVYESKMAGASKIEISLHSNNRIILSQNLLRFEFELVLRIFLPFL